MRKVIAQRLTESKQTIPHYYLTQKIQMNSLLSLRKSINTDNTKISINDFVIKAISKASKEVPEANSQWNNQSIIQYDNVDVSFAVDIGDGLITPIVK